MYSRLLEMCGFEPQEIRQDKNRIEKTFICESGTCYTFSLLQISELMNDRF